MKWKYAITIAFDKKKYVIDRMKLLKSSYGELVRNCNIVKDTNNQYRVTYERYADFENMGVIHQ